MKHEGFVALSNRVILLDQISRKQVEEYFLVEVCCTFDSELEYSTVPAVSYTHSWTNNRVIYC